MVIFIIRLLDELVVLDEESKLMNMDSLVLKGSNIEGGHLILMGKGQKN